LAVASGRPALGRFPVHKPGKVVLYAAEDDAPAIRRRMVDLCRARDLDLEQLPVGLIREHGLRLDHPEHRQRLADTLRRVKPRMLILDPLVRLHRGDENSSSDTSELLGFLRRLQREYQVAIVLVHHTRKSPAGQPGQALRGSGDLHAWTDSALYLLRKNDRLVLHAEHRAHPAPDPMAIALRSDPTHLEITDVAEVSPATLALQDRVVDVLMKRPVSRSRLRAMLRVRNERLGAALERLEQAGRIQRADGVWSVPIPTL